MTALHQPDLWDMARRTDPETSWDAAANALANADTDRARVLAVHRAHPDGLTDFELAELMGRQQTSVGKRRGELCAQGLVEYAGIKRPAPSGSMSRVWKAVSPALVTAQQSPRSRPPRLSGHGASPLRGEGSVSSK